MNQIKLYKYATWALLLLNAGVIAFFLLTKPSHKPPHHQAPNNNLRVEIIDILDLDDQQKSDFEKLANAHHQDMMNIQKQNQHLLKNYLKSLSNDSENAIKSNTLEKIQQLEIEKIEVTHQHLLDIKYLLNEKQLIHYPEFLALVIDKLVVNNKKNPPPPKDIK